MFDIEFLKTSKYFSSKTLQRWELLFDEGDVDPYFSIIVSWKVLIEKYIEREKWTVKELAVLRAWDFLWEGSMSHLSPKDVRALAWEYSEILQIEWQEKFSQFLEAYPLVAKDMLLQIIYISNQRVIESNAYITSMHQITTAIRELDHFTLKEIIQIFSLILEVLHWEFLLFLEANPVLNWYFTLKYDSRTPGKLHDLVLEKWKYSLDDIGIEWDVKLLTKELKIWKEVLWNIVIGRKEVFNKNEQRIFLGIIASLTIILKQKKLLEEERDKEFSSWY